MTSRRVYTSDQVIMSRCKYRYFTVLVQSERGAVKKRSSSVVGESTLSFFVVSELDLQAALRDGEIDIFGKHRHRTLCSDDGRSALGTRIRYDTVLAGQSGQIKRQRQLVQ